MKIKLKINPLLLVLLLLITVSLSSRESTDYDHTVLTNEHRQQLAMSIDDPLILSFFADSRFRVYEVAQKKRNYNQITVDFYRSPSFGLFTPAGKAQARKFIDEHKSYLKKALERFNLSPDAAPVISTLAGIEYSWGNSNPKSRVFNSLYSVYKQIPAQKNFAIRNIKGLLRGINNPAIEIDAFTPSSFMGAVGYCQLMPFWFTDISERNIEAKLDLDGDGVFDPFSMPDAIAFFAWYLSESGFNSNKWRAVKSYNGQGPAAEAFADAVIEFAEKI
ncbi:MAG: lytic murein transglycosylase [Elusimicrobiota bacterium]